MILQQELSGLKTAKRSQLKKTADGFTYLGAAQFHE